MIKNFSILVIIFVIGAVLGGLAVYRYKPAPAQVEQKGKINRDIQIFPDGSKHIQETKTYDNSSSKFLPDNLIVLSDLKKSAEVVVRPFDNLPIYGAAEYDLEHKEAKVKVGYGFRF